MTRCACPELGKPRVLAAKQALRRIAVEVKSLVGDAALERLESIFAYVAPRMTVASIGILMELSLSGLMSALALTPLEFSRRCCTALSGAFVAPIHCVGSARPIGVHETTIASTEGLTCAIYLTPAAVITIA
jgi:hypothetical protein